MKRLRFVLAAVAVLGFAWFALPLALSVTVNIGNMTGMLVAVLLLLYALFLPHIHAGIRRLLQHKVKRWIIYPGFAILLGIAGLVVAESACMISAACKEPQKDATVIVLGCRVYGENASLSLKERLDAAYTYLTEYETANCILSGGQGEGENITEAECMYRYLVNRGIDASRLIKEEQSSSTRENLLYSGQLIKENGWNSKLAIVTSDYHVYRAGRIAESLGMEYGAVPGRSAWWLFPTHYVRELYGILYEWLGL